MTLKNIEEVKRELRKALGLPDASDGSFDNTTYFKVQSYKSKAIGGLVKLLFGLKTNRRILNSNRL